MWWPSKEIQQFTTLLSANKFSAEDIAFFDGVDKNDVAKMIMITLFLSWSTYRYDLHKNVVRMGMKLSCG